jgi:predicted metal-dependent phosphoesterase TrpH
LDYIAITDHNTLDFALAARAALGKAIIVGEEITTREGELIGLFLQSVIPGGLSSADTVIRIHSQGGLVYVPHPFETVRSGITLSALNSIAAEVDIIEVHNGRAVFQNRGAQAKAWAQARRTAGAASSDTHGWHGWGNTYSSIDRAPEADTLPDVLQAARYQSGTVGLRGLLYPTYNRLRKALHRA